MLTDYEYFHRPPCDICGNSFKIGDNWECFCTVDQNIAIAIKKAMSKNLPRLDIKEIVDDVTRSN